MDIFFQLIINGLLLGGTFAIISVGLTLIFGIVRVINFAHGEFLMVGLYAVYLMTNHLGLHPYIATVPAIILLFIAGALMQRFIIQPLLNADPHIQIFATVGISTALLNFALLVFGADVFSVRLDDFTSNRVRMGAVSATTGPMITFVLSIALIVGLHIFLKVTYLGRAIRATAQNRYAAQLMGVNVEWIYIITFGLGCACLGLASGLLLPQYPVFPTVGSFFVLTAFVIVVLGGLGSLGGAFLGSMIIGLVDSLSGYYIAPDLKEVVYFLIFLVILVLRPTGLLGLGRGSE